MSQYMAILNEENHVINIIVANDGEPETEKQIIYTSDNPAFIDGDYVDGYFYPPKPFESWSRNGLGHWIPPKEQPTDGFYIWDESQLDWVNVEAQS